MNALMSKFLSDMSVLKAREIAREFKKEEKKKTTRNRYSAPPFNRQVDHRVRYAFMIGQRFGKLVVVGIENNNEEKHSMGCLVKCKCDCGGIKDTRRMLLVRKFTKSCGCLRPGPKATW